jgi:hypothetical protein
MMQSTFKALLVGLAISLSLPAFADRDHDEGERHWRHHHRHDHDRGYYRGGYGGPGCRVEGWFDRAGYYRERQICPEARVVMPYPPLPPARVAIFPPMPPAVVLQPPSVMIQPPGVYIR